MSWNFEQITALLTILTNISDGTPISAQSIADLLGTISAEDANLDAWLHRGLTPAQVANENPEMFTETGGDSRFIRLSPIYTGVAGEDTFVTFFRYTDTPDLALVRIYKGDGTFVDFIEFDPQTPRISIWGNEVYHEGNLPMHNFGFANASFYALEHEWAAGDDTVFQFVGTGGTAVAAMGVSDRNGNPDGGFVATEGAYALIDMSVEIRVVSGGIDIRKTSDAEGFPVKVSLLALVMDL